MARDVVSSDLALGNPDEFKRKIRHLTAANFMLNTAIYVSISKYAEGTGIEVVCLDASNYAFKIILPAGDREWQTGSIDDIYDAVYDIHSMVVGV